MNEELIVDSGEYPGVATPKFKVGDRVRDLVTQNVFYIASAVWQPAFENWCYSSGEDTMFISEVDLEGV
ncbi:hypothetical protein KASHIRA_02500 [Serratia phage vB_SmaM-Kashira]|nr:hypothetical protein [Acinetobacter phage ABPH49]URC22824.1 hypothetical protein KASHIRA_02500 [Serratia phage vB_SmaM-Kashira]